MIVYKKWFKWVRAGNMCYNCDGWFLLGIIPLYVREFPTR